MHPVVRDSDRAMVQTYLNLGRHMDGAVPSGTVRTVPKEAGPLARLLGPRGRRPPAATGHRCTHAYRVSITDIMTGEELYIVSKTEESSLLSHIS
jgi:hypothetical protein